MSSEAETVSIPRRGLLLVLSSPSGAGKTTLARRLLASDDNLVMSVSATTRPMRPGEVDGRDYHFRSKDQFEAEIAEGAFLEYARVFGNVYGTPREPVEAAIAAGRDPGGLGDLRRDAVKRVKAAHEQGPVQLELPLIWRESAIGF